MSNSTTAGSAFQKEIRVPSNFGIATNISPDGQAATILFDNLYLDVTPAQQGGAGTLNQTAIQTKVFTAHVPFSTDQRSITMAMDLRGFVNTEAGAIARLVACAGDTTKCVALATDNAKAIELKGKSKKTVTEEHPDVQFGNFQDRVEFTVQVHAAKPVCQITLLLLVEHDTDKNGGALLAVDSLDLSITKPAKGSFKS